MDRRASASIRTQAMEPAEQELIRACQAGAPGAFRRLVEQYERRVYGVAYGIVHDRELARDVAQEAFLRVFRALDTFDLSRPFYTWLYHIVVNLSIDALRKKRHDQPADLEAAGGLADHRASPEDAVQRSELQERVRRVLDRLPVPFRVALTLRDLRGFTAPEIAAMVGSTPVTIRWRIHEARKRFKELWERETGIVPIEGGPERAREGPAGNTSIEPP
jgi:RNA polymerase sigma-70 factor (ECF subfamily)